MNKPDEEPWSILRLLDWTTRYLEEKGSESARLDAEVRLDRVPASGGRPRMGAGGEEKYAPRRGLLART